MIDQDYLFKSLVDMRTILIKFNAELLEKYSDYTKVRAIRKLFDYIFKTPIMDFDNEFEVDIESDNIGVMKTTTSRREGLSSSERLYFDIWIAHSHNSGFEFNSCHFYGIGNREKLGYFIENIDLLKS